MREPWRANLHQIEEASHPLSIKELIVPPSSKPKNPSRKFRLGPKHSQTPEYLKGK